jgi:hypothetical protein
VGYSQIPPDFTRITERSGAVRYIAPSWPSMYLRIKLPEGYRGGGGFDQGAGVGDRL